MPLNFLHKKHNVSYLLSCHRLIPVEKIADNVVFLKLVKIKKIYLIHKTNAHNYMPIKILYFTEDYV